MMWYFLFMSDSVMVISLTCMLLFEVVFFICITAIIVNNRKNYDAKHRQLSSDLKALKELMVKDFKDILKAVKDIKG